MVKKIKKYLKLVVCCALILSLIAPSYAALSASDGSAFVTKAEFDSALADFNARLTTFEAGINSKIDSQVTSYLDRNGIWNGKLVSTDASATTRKTASEGVWEWDIYKTNTTLVYNSEFPNAGSDNWAYTRSASEAGIAYANSISCASKRLFLAEKSGLVYLPYVTRLDFCAYFNIKNNGSVWYYKCIADVDGLCFDNLITKKSADDVGNYYPMLASDDWYFAAGLMPNSITTNMEILEENTKLMTVVPGQTITSNHLTYGSPIGQGAIFSAEPFVGVSLFFVSKGKSYSVKPSFAGNARNKGKIAFYLDNNPLVCIFGVKDALIY